MRSPSEAELKPVERIWPQRTEAAPAAHVFEGWKDLRPAGTRVTVFGNGPYMRAEQATGRSFEQCSLRLDERLSSAPAHLPEP